MERIYPLDRASCSSYVGRRVCAVLQDGSQVVATLTGVDENGIILNGEIQSSSTVSEGRRGKTWKKGKAAKTSVAGYGYNPVFGSGALFISWALLALLFAIPFF